MALRTIALLGISAIGAQADVTLTIVTAWRAIGPEPCLGLTQLGVAPPGRWSVRPTTISAPL